ncbi:MAG TPA: universal stress protein [Usitatibacter sp.]|nr:universal stress protein [Usitatibacter sp.]
MLKVLVASDGSDNAVRAAAHVGSLARRGISIEAVACNVQPPVMSGEVGVIATVERAEQRRTRNASEALEAVARPLRESNVALTFHEASGDAAVEIVAAAGALRCDGIVLGCRGLGVVAGAVLGSVSAQVVRASPLPVTLVK